MTSSSHATLNLKKVKDIGITSLTRMSRILHVVLYLSEIKI